MFQIFFSLRRFQLNGVINRLKSKQFLRSNPPGTNYSVVSLGDIAPTLTIVTGGMILALFILIIEKMYYFFNTWFKSNESKNRVLAQKSMFLAQNYKSETVRRI